MERIEDALVGGNQISSSNQNMQNLNANGNEINSGQSNASSSCNNGNQSGNERPAVSYSMPGILHYLQHEWNRYELDRYNKRVFVLSTPLYRYICSVVVVNMHYL